MCVKAPPLVCWLQRGAWTLVDLQVWFWLGKHQSQGSVGPFCLGGFGINIEHPLKRQLLADVNRSPGELCCNSPCIRLLPVSKV